MLEKIKEYHENKKKNNDDYFMEIYGAFMIAGAVVFGAYQLGSFTKDPVEIVKNLQSFEKCEVLTHYKTRPDSREHTSYSEKLLHCTLSEKQQSTPENLKEANVLYEKSFNEVVALPSSKVDELEEKLDAKNGQNTPKQVIDERTELSVAIESAFDNGLRAQEYLARNKYATYVKHNVKTLREMQAEGIEQKMENYPKNLPR